MSHHWTKPHPNVPDVIKLNLKLDNIVEPNVTFRDVVGPNVARPSEEGDEMGFELILGSKVLVGYFSQKMV